MQSDAILSADRLREQIPSYLTGPQQQALVAALGKLPDHKDYFLNNTRFSNVLLQGDCWGNCAIFNYSTGDKKSVKCLILSNSCDVSDENKRDTVPRVVVAPVIALEKLNSLLRKNNVSEDRIDEINRAVRNQALTSIFYLPDAVGGLGKEYITFLDDLHSIPLDAFLISCSGHKRFSLNYVGFYLLIFKISLHFCRLKEGVDRS